MLPEKQPKRISFSRLSTGNTCSHLYWARYKSGKMQTAKSSWFQLGTLVHEAIEKYFELEFPPANPDQFIRNALDELIREWAGPTFLAALTVYTACYETLIAKAKKEYGKPTKNIKMTNVWKKKYALELQDDYDEHIKPLEDMKIEVPIDPDYYHGETGKTKDVYVIWRTDPAEMYSVALQCCLNFIKLQAEVENEVKVQTEVSLIQMAYDNGRDPLVINGYIQNGYIDRVEVFPDGTCKIYDYKTGKHDKKVMDCLNSDQLARYAWAWEQLTGLRVTHIGFWNLRNGNVVECAFTDDVARRFLNRFNSQIHQYEFREAMVENGLLRDLTYIGGVPSGTEFGSPCKNCDLMYERDEALKCPYYVTDEEIA